MTTVDFQSRVDYYENECKNFFESFIDIDFGKKTQYIQEKNGDYVVKELDRKLDPAESIAMVIKIVALIALSIFTLFCLVIRWYNRSKIDEKNIKVETVKEGRKEIFSDPGSDDGKSIKSETSVEVFNPISLNKKAESLKLDENNLETHRNKFKKTKSKHCPSIQRWLGTNS